MFLFWLLACVHPVLTPATLPPPALATSALRPATASDLTWIVADGAGGWLVQVGPGGTPTGAWETGYEASGARLWLAPTDEGIADEVWWSGDARCVTTGEQVARVAEFSDTMDAEDNTEPHCGTPMTWARVTCDGEPTDVAVPEGVAPPEDYVERAPAAPELATRLEAAAVAVPEVRTAALEVLDDPTLSITVVDLRGFTGSAGDFWLATVDVMTGQGQWSCGGEDAFTRVFVLFDAAERVVWSNGWVEQEPWVGRLHDLEHDGIPELEEGNGHGTWFTGGSVSVLSYTEGFCMCGC